MSEDSSHRDRNEELLRMLRLLSEAGAGGGEGGGNGGPDLSFLSLLGRPNKDGQWAQLQKNLHEAIGANDEGTVTSTMIQISQTIAMESELSLGRQGFRVDQFTEDIAMVLSLFGSETALYACRILNTLVDIFPEIVATKLRSCGAYQSFAARLASVDSFELAEESVQTLSHLVRIDPVSVLQSGCVTGVLGILDFFAISTQKSILGIAVGAISHASQRDLEGRLMPTVPSLIEAHRNSTDPDIATQALRALAAITSIILLSRDSKAKAMKDAKSTLFDDDSSFLNLVFDTFQCCCCNTSKTESTSSSARTKMSFDSPVTILACDILNAACLIGGKNARKYLSSLKIETVLYSAFQQCGVLTDDSQTSASSGTPSAASCLTSSGPIPVSHHIDATFIESLVGLVDSLVQIPQSMPKVSTAKICSDSSKCTDLSYVLKQEREHRLTISMSLIFRKGGSDKCIKLLSSSWTPLIKKSENVDFSQRMLRATHHALLKVCSLTSTNEQTSLFSMFTMLKELFWNPPTMINSLVSAMPDDAESILGKDSYTTFIGKQLRSSSSRVQALAILMIILILVRAPTCPKSEFIRDCARDGVIARLAQLSSATSESEESSDELKTLITVANTLIGSDHDSATKDAAQLRAASEAILAAKTSGAVIDSLKQLRDLLTTGRNGVSTYELTQSNAISNLLSFFVSPPEILAGSETERFNQKYAIIRDRLQAFITVFFGDISPATSDSSEDRKALKLLIERLVESISLSPAFKTFDFTPFLVKAQGNGFMNRDANISMRLLSKSLKIRLRRHENEKTLEETTTDSFGIDAFAGLSAIEAFLLRRIGSGLSGDPPRLPLVSDMPPVNSVSIERDRINTLSGHRLMFTMNGRPLDSDDIMIDIVRNHPEAKAILSSFSSSQPGPEDGNHPLKSLWDITYTVHYQLATEESWRACRTAEEPRPRFVPPVVVPVRYSPLPYFLATYSSPFSDSHTFFDYATKQSLELLDILYYINKQARCFVNPGRPSVDSPILPRNLFMSRELTSSLEQQMSDIIVQCFPAAIARWAQCIAESRLKFLLSPEQRLKYFRLRFTPIRRAFSSLHMDDYILGKFPKEKRRITLSRRSMLNSAVSLMNTMSRSSELDVEYNGEPGIGLGPVLEYFSIVSHEVQQKSLQVFVDESTDDTQQFISNPSGLFPAVMRNPSDIVMLKTSQEVEFSAIGDSTSYQRTVDKKQLFFFLGAFTATALADGRILDANFAPTFLKLLVGNEPLSYEDLARSQASLFSSLYPLVDAVRNGQNTIGGMAVEDLALTMCVPGHPDYELEPHGADIIVNGKTLPSYVEKLVKAVLSTGVETPLDCFFLGLRHILVFDDNTNSSPFSVFEPYELSQIISGSDDRQPWDRDTILSSMGLEYGYTRDSTTITNLVNLMASFTGAQRRLFLLFVTGSPRLPIGGFPALSPKFTVSCKRPVANNPSSPSGRMETDSMLPSANCCFSLLKLPDYSTPEILREKILYAIENCQGSFDLS